MLHVEVRSRITTSLLCKASPQKFAAAAVTKTNVFVTLTEAVSKSSLTPFSKQGNLRAKFSKQDGAYVAHFRLLQGQHG